MLEIIWFSFIPGWLSHECHLTVTNGILVPGGRGQVDRAAGINRRAGGDSFDLLVPGGGDKACGNPVATAGIKAMRPRHADKRRRGGTKKLFPGFGAGRERAGFMTCLPVGLPRDGRRAGIAAAPVQPAILGPGRGGGDKPGFGVVTIGGGGCSRAKTGRKLFPVSGFAVWNTLPLWEGRTSGSSFGEGAPVPAGAGISIMR